VIAAIHRVSNIRRKVRHAEIPIPCSFAKISHIAAEYQQAAPQTIIWVRTPFVGLQRINATLRKFAQGIHTTVPPTSLKQMAPTVTIATFALRLINA